MEETLSRDQLEAAVLKVLTRHPSSARAVGMGELYEAVFKRTWTNRINGTRALRKLITDLRQQGVPIGSTASQTGGGYYLATTQKELADFCGRLRSQGLSKLKLEADIRKTTLPHLLNEVQLNLRAEP